MAKLLIVLAILVVVAIIVSGIFGIISYFTSRRNGKLPADVRMLPAADQNHYLERQKAANLLLRQLLDPTSAHSESWKEEAQQVVDKMYN